MREQDEGPDRIEYFCYHMVCGVGVVCGYVAANFLNVIERFG